MDEHLRLRRYLNEQMWAARVRLGTQVAGALVCGSVVSGGALVLAACTPTFAPSAKSEGNSKDGDRPIDVSTAVPDDRPHVLPTNDSEGLGTTGSAPQPEPPDPLVATTGGPDAPDAANLDRSGLPTGHSCPSSTWCASKKIAKTLAGEGTKYSDGCADSLDLSKLAGRNGAAYDGLNGFSYGNHIEDAPNEGEGTGECCYRVASFCGGGRPLRDASGLIDAELVATPLECDVARGLVADGHGLVVGAGETHTVREEVLASYMEDAKDEWSSVASFARAAVELMLVGAPVHLVTACQEASLDEVRHAQLCLEVAGQLSGQRLAPGALRRVPQIRSLDLSALAVAVLHEGCVEETLAALVADRCAQRCTTPSLRERLLSLAHDEARHAALAWETLDWALERGGEQVRMALEAELVRLWVERASLVASLTQRGRSVDLTAASDASGAMAQRLMALRAYGRINDVERAQVLERGWLEVVLPMLEERGIKARGAVSMMC